MIEAIKKEMVKINVYDMGSIDEKLVEEENANIEHAKVACKLENDVNKLKVESFVDDRKLECARLCFEEMNNKLKS